MQLQVINSPFNQEQVELLNRLLPNLTASQQIWLGGYLSALPKTKLNPSSHVGLQTATTLNSRVSTKEVTILYGSQTGNGQGLAEKLSENLQAENYRVTLRSMNEFKHRELTKIEYLLIIVSTHGDGDPPDNALPFYEYLYSKRVPRLENLQYSVLALGDSSYEHFCLTGKQFDQRLTELGAKRLGPRVDCDVDFDEPAAEWFAQILFKLNEHQGARETSNQSQSTVSTLKQSPYDRTNPFQAEVLENINLNGRGSNKETRHLELLLEGSNLLFEPGDSLGIYPKNDPNLVDALIKELQWNPEELVEVGKKEGTLLLRNALISHFEITVLTKPLLEKIVQLTNNKQLSKFLKDSDEKTIRQYLSCRDVLDLVRDFSLSGVFARDLIAVLRKIPPRLYSIASSLKAYPGEVHLTIGAVRYEAHGRIRTGVCSVQCAERIEPGDFLSVYVQRNSNFKLPDDPNTPIIMIGAGTGIAPYRSFLQEREEIAANGKTWLFFGDQHYVTDFLYQVEWQRWLKSGVLTRMDVAFSRDTDKKVYVQHKILEHSKAIYEWIEKGAVIYICGDEQHMAADVHATLMNVIEKEGGKNRQEAMEYLATLQQQKRYQRDVY